MRYFSQSDYVSVSHARSLRNWIGSAVQTLTVDIWGAGPAGPFGAAGPQ